MTRTVFLTAFALLVLCAPAFAEPVAEKKNGLGGAMFVPAILLLLAFPLAVMVRALHRVPMRIAEANSGSGHFARLLGVANVLLIVLVGSAAKNNKVIGIITLLLLLAFAVLAFFGLSAAAVKLGRKLFASEERGVGVGAFALAWLLLSGLSLVPILGFLYLLWWVTWGMGATLFTLFGRTNGEATAEP